MEPSVLDVVCCPTCGAALRLEEDHGGAGDISAGTLVCRGEGGHRYPITVGVPELLPEQGWSTDKRQTERSFSAKWKRAPEYRRRTGPFYTRWYLDRYGFKDLVGLSSFLAGKQRILDAGTGLGRDAMLYAEHLRAEVFGIDISEGIFTAHRELKDVPNLRLIRADLTRLPFPPACFDFIACDQVLHHTPDPPESLRGLVSRLRSGGHIAFYVYRKKGPIREFCDDFLRAATTEMTEEECYRFAEAITGLGRTLTSKRVTVEIPEDIPLLEIKAGQYDLQRFFHWQIFKCVWNDEFDWESNVIVNFDWYHPKDAHRYTVDDVQAWCREERLAVTHLDVGDAGISVLAARE
jgi:SAM-dependent methyltransferase/uncharacterized protein YbaR (Trm112 family)